MGGKYSIVGGRIENREHNDDALVRRVKQQTGLDSSVGDTVCAFNEIPSSGYYIPGTDRLFVDNVVYVGSRLVTLDHRARSFVWMPPDAALRDLDIEPNARKTIEKYVQMNAHQI